MVKIGCINGTTEAMLIIIEPWAEEYWLKPGMSVDVIGQGGVMGGSFEVEYFEKGIIFYGWEGSVVSVLINSKEAFPSPQI